MSNSQRLLIIASVWPEPDSSAAGRRMVQLIRLFKSAGIDITYASTAGESEYAHDLSELGIEQVKVKMNSSTFDDFVSELQPSIVLFDRFPVEEQFGWRVAEQCPEAMRMLDTQDLHSLRRARGKALREGVAFTKDRLLREEIAKREIASILRCDLSLIISEHEIKILREVFAVDDALLHYVPFILEGVDQAARRLWPSYQERSHFVTIGNFRHPPNRDAVQYLSNTIWPLVREQLPKAELHVYGAYPDQQMLSLHKPETGFYVKGRVEDAQAVVNEARVCLAPLRFGAGLKGKLTEAMQCGAPSVTTPVGAEGIANTADWCGAVAEDSQELADAAVELYSNKGAWNKAQKRGVKIINGRFKKEVHGPKLLSRISELQEQMESHRLQNFTGAMLLHHTAASTKYMARWIEAKNK
jgi:glycosyltransferase involved in cell wall biosynthesis